jgi:hypothetical protein
MKNLYGIQGIAAHWLDVSGGGLNPVPVIVMYMRERKIK